MRVGHRIIDINGTSTVGMKHTDIVHLLSSTVGDVSACEEGRGPNGCLLVQYFGTWIIIATGNSMFVVLTCLSVCLFAASHSHDARHNVQNPDRQAAARVLLRQWCTGVQDLGGTKEHVWQC